MCMEKLGGELDDGSTEDFACKIHITLRSELNSVRPLTQPRNAMAGGDDKSKTLVPPESHIQC
jgi:hypothetical protein